MTEMTTANPLLSKLNKQQREAAMYTEGPLLILAGAGSGKTSTMTHRIAYMIEELHINPYQILAVTFTNKAAGEMRDRVEALVGEGLTMWILTFHSACLRILRKTCRKSWGYGTDFAVYDPTDQKTVVKNIIKELGLDPNEIQTGILPGGNKQVQGTDRYRRQNTSWKTGMTIRKSAFTKCIFAMKKR